MKKHITGDQYFCKCEYGTINEVKRRLIVSMESTPSESSETGRVKRFVVWCKERQIELPAADLWTVTTETA